MLKRSTAWLVCGLALAACGKDDSPPTVDEVNAKLDRLAAQAPPRAEAPEPEPALQARTPEPLPEPPPEPPKPRRKPLPPPLKPDRGVIGHEVDGQSQSPCARLVGRVCALLTEGSEECGEARDKLRRRPHLLDQQRCADALSWYVERVEEAKRVRPCRLLAQVRCAHFGPDSARCQTAKRDAHHMEKYLLHACKADLLLFRGL